MIHPRSKNLIIRNFVDTSNTIYTESFVRSNCVHILFALQDRLIDNQRDRVRHTICKTTHVRPHLINMSWQTLQEPTIYSDLHSRDIDIAIKHPRAPDHLNQSQYNIGHRTRACAFCRALCAGSARYTMAVMEAQRAGTRE